MNSVKDQLTILVTLQDAENRIQKIEKDLAVVDDRIQSLDKEVSEFRAKVDAARDENGELKKQYRDDEGEVKRLEGQIEKSQEKLRSVKTNKEYQSMLKEIDELKKQKSEKEDQMITSLERIETLENEIKVLEADLADLTAEINTKQNEIQENAQSQRDMLADMTSRRDGIYTTLDVKIGTLFSRVKQKSSGIGVAGVLDEVCQVCRMNIPPQLFIELMRMQTVLMCPHCQRIIYPQTLIEDYIENGSENN